MYESCQKVSRIILGWGLLSFQKYPVIVTLSQVIVIE